MKEYIKIAGLENQFEAQILSDILKDQKIPHLLKSYYDSSYDGIFQGQKGWGAVFAPAEYGTEIVETLAGLRLQAKE